MTWDVRETNTKLLSNGTRLTQGLFYEFYNSNEEAPYTLKERDITKGDKHYVSLCRVYLESADEYEAAMRLVGSWAHWQKLCNLQWFMKGMPQFGFEGLESLRETMAARDRSLARKKLIEAAEQGNVTAAKAILESAPKQKAGRPQKGTPDKSLDTVVELFGKVQQ